MDGRTDGRELTFHDTQKAVLLFSSLFHVIFSYVSFSPLFHSPRNPRTIQYLIHGRATKVKLVKPSENLTTSLPGPLVELSNEFPEGRHSGRQINSRTICDPQGFHICPSSASCFQQPFCPVLSTDVLLRIRSRVSFSWMLEAFSQVTTRNPRHSPTQPQD